MNAFPGIARSAAHQLPIDAAQFAHWRETRVEEWQDGPNLLVRNYTPQRCPPPRCPFPFPDADDTPQFRLTLPMLMLKEG